MVTFVAVVGVAAVCLFTFLYAIDVWREGYRVGGFGLFVLGLVTAVASTYLLFRP